MATRQSLTVLARTTSASTLRQQTRSLHRARYALLPGAAVVFSLVVRQSRPVLQGVTAGSRIQGRVVTPASAARWRGYSTEKDVALTESKIWDFEGISKLIQDPEHKVVLVDVREPGELQDTGKIPGAVNIPITTSPDGFHISEDEFEDRFGYPRPAKDAEVVLYCRAGVRGRAAATLAKDAGWTDVGEYPGSWLDWAAKGGKVER